MDIKDWDLVLRAALAAENEFPEFSELEAQESMRKFEKYVEAIRAES